MTHMLNRFNEILNSIELSLRRTRLYSYPLHLNIVPTKLCNLRCIFCIQYATDRDKELSPEDFGVIAKKLFPYAKMAHFVSGGEPFLNKNFLKFLSVCRDYRLPARVSTNGMLLSEEICQELAENNSLKVIRFSFDGSRKETVEKLRKGIDYDRVVESMRSMAEFKKRYNRKDLILLIRCAVMKSNIDELPDLVRKAATWGIDILQVSYLNVANAIEKSESLYYHPDIAKRIFEESARVAQSTKIRLILPQPLVGKSQTKKCHHPWQFIKIDPDGSVRFCYKSWNNPIGNIFLNDFQDVWNNPQYQLIRKTVNSQQSYFRYCKICSWRCGYTSESSHIQYLHNEWYDFDGPSA